MNNFLSAWDAVLTEVVTRLSSGFYFVKKYFGTTVSLTVKEQVIFMKRLAMMLQSGMPIVTALELFESEASTPMVKRLSKSLADDVSSGLLLSTAFLKFKNSFGDFSINIIKVGEISGTLPQNLEYIARELKKKHELQKQILGALLYPLIIILATFAITLFLIIYIFPKILPIFLSLKATLPLSTRILIFSSDFLESYWYLVVFGFLFVWFVYVQMRKIPSVHYWVDMSVVRIPVLGSLCVYYNLSNIYRTLGLLLQNEVRIAHALEITAASTQHQGYKRIIEDATSGVIKGQVLSKQFKDSSKLFPSLCIQMMQAGESTGNLGTTLEYLSDMYEGEMKDATKNLTTVLEPLLMLTMGLCVGFIAVSIITPIYGITQNLH